MRSSRLLLSSLLVSLLSLTHLKANTFESDFHEDTRHWIGSDFWANRLQDWRVTMGRLECLEGASNKPLRTVHWLTGDVSPSGGPFQLKVRTGTLGFENLADGSSFSGFLIGAGEGGLDYRGASLVHNFAGPGGGLLAVFNDKGQSQFISNSGVDKDVRPVLAIGANNSSETRTGGLGNFEDYEITLNVSAVVDGKRSLELSVVNLFDGKTVTRASLDSYPADKLVGNIALVSHGGKATERRYWFRDFKAAGKGIEIHPDRHFGPILGVIYSLDDSRLKLNAQFPPLGFNDASEAVLELREGGEWKPVAKESIESPSFTALFDVTTEVVLSDCDYRVGYAWKGDTYWFEGKIQAAPEAGEEVTVAGITCYQNMGLSADGTWGAGAAGSPDGRWLSPNVWFPHTNLVERIQSQKPDLIALLGDQIYENGNPSGSDHSEGNPHIDYLYKWYLTLWDLRRLTRNIPTVVLVDDHDVYQGDLWGNSGTPIRDGDNKAGGYAHEPEFVHMVERTQTGANPEPLSRETLRQGLRSYYTDFKLGDVNFVILEDRKFKSLPGLVGPVEKYGSKIVNKGYDGRDADIPDGEILGKQQESYVQDWIKRTDGVRIGFSQTTFVSLHTAPSGDYWLDLDSGGWPQTPRDRALKIFGEGDVILMAGDTHLPSVVQHGVETYGDSVWQFVVPAVANKYRRWWEPKIDGANRRSGEPYYTGDFEDGFENLMTVAAVGNPKISNQEMFEINTRRNIGYASEHLFLDKFRNRDGYGLIVVSPDRSTVRLECWPAEVGTPQHEGWPIVLKKDSESGKWVRSF